MEIPLSDLISEVDEVEEASGSEEQAEDQSAATKSLAKTEGKEVEDSFEDFVGEFMVAHHNLRPPAVVKLEENEMKNEVEDSFEDFVGEFTTGRGLRAASTNTKTEENENEDVFGEFVQEFMTDRQLRPRRNPKPKPRNARTPSRSRPTPQPTNYGAQWKKPFDILKPPLIYNDENCSNNGITWNPFEPLLDCITGHLKDMVNSRRLTEGNYDASSVMNYFENSYGGSNGNDYGEEDANDYFEDNSGRQLKAIDLEDIDERTQRKVRWNILFLG